ncbi:MAG: stalk domain-containing protein [Eubacteriales bacterium]|nr:stalk domain-containing protein [Eubacteriales bacterium]
MKLQKTLSVSLSALFLLGAAAFPAKAVGDSTVEQVDEMIQGLGGQTDADGIPLVIAPAPDALYSIVIDGEYISGKAAVAVPLRAVAEKLGFAVTWCDGVITVDDGQTRCTITVGVDRYQTENSAPDVPGISAPVSLGMAPYVVDGVSYVPVALFDQLLGMEGIVGLENGAVVIDTCRREDSSGDYNVYPQVETVDGITLKGENGSVRLALWTADGYTYAVSLAQGATRREVLALVHEIS